MISTTDTIAMSLAQDICREHEAAQQSSTRSAAANCLIAQLRPLVELP